MISFIPVAYTRSGGSLRKDPVSSRTVEEHSGTNVGIQRRSGTGRERGQTGRTLLLRQ